MISPPGNARGTVTCPFWAARRAASRRILPCSATASSSDISPVGGGSGGNSGLIPGAVSNAEPCSSQHQHRVTQQEIKTLVAKPPHGVGIAVAFELSPPTPTLGARGNTKQAPMRFRACESVRASRVQLTRTSMTCESTARLRGRPPKTTTKQKYLWRGNGRRIRRVDDTHNGPHGSCEWCEGRRSHPGIRGVRYYR